jgi:uncharacterized LabA/DUF88 family protein
MSPFGVRDDQRVAVFIDGTGLYHATRENGWDIDYKRLHAHFENAAMLYRVLYFTMLPEDQDVEYSAVVPLVDWLSYNEYRVITKTMPMTVDGEGRRRLNKNSILCEMVVEMMESVAFADHLVLFSGDANLRYAVEAVQRRGAKVTVVFPKGMTANELRRGADRCVELNDPALRELIGKGVSRAGTPPNQGLTLATVGTR